MVMEIVVTEIVVVVKTEMTIPILRVEAVLCGSNSNSKSKTDGCSDRDRKATGIEHGGEQLLDETEACGRPNRPTADHTTASGGLDLVSPIQMPENPPVEGCLTRQGRRQSCRGQGLFDWMLSRRLALHRLVIISRARRVARRLIGQRLLTSTPRTGACFPMAFN